MIARLLYHSFWNIYDHLGALVLLIVIYVAAAGVIAAGITLLPPALLALLFFAANALILAAALPFGARAAAGDVARIPHLLQGIRAYGLRMLLLTLAVAGLLLLCYMNFRIYLDMQSSTEGGTRLFVTLLAGLQGWLTFLMVLIIWPIFCSATTRAGRASPYFWFREALVAFTIQPILWMTTTFGLSLLFVLAGWSQFGLLFYLPLAAMIAQTAWFLTRQYMEFLAEARAQTAGEMSVRELKARAWDLALRWEAEQPRRTARELLRPWEM